MRTAGLGFCQSQTCCLPNSESGLLDESRDEIVDFGGLHRDGPPVDEPDDVLGPQGEEYGASSHPTALHRVEAGEEAHHAVPTVLLLLARFVTLDVGLK